MAGTQMPAPNLVNEIGIMSECVGPSHLPIGVIIIIVIISNIMYCYFLFIFSVEIKPTYKLHEYEVY